MYVFTPTSTVPCNQPLEYSWFILGAATIASNFGEVILKYPQPIPSHGMDRIVEELREQGVLGTYIQRMGWSFRVFQQTIPEPKVSSSSHVVVSDDIGGVCDPHCCWRDVICS